MTDATGKELFNLGISLFKSGKYEEAEEKLLEVVNQDEEDHKAWNALGIIYTKLKLFEEADVCFYNAEYLYPQSEIYKKNRAIASGKKPRDKKIPDTPGAIRKKQTPFPFPFSMKHAAGIIGVIILVIIIIYAGLNLFSFFAENMAFIQQTHIINTTNSSPPISGMPGGGIMNSIDNIQIPVPEGSNISYMDTASRIVHGTNASSISSPDNIIGEGILEKTGDIQVTTPDGSSLSLMDSASTMLSAKNVQIGTPAGR